MSAPYKVEPLTTRRRSPLILVWAGAYLTEFEDQTPSNPASAAC